jgi:hypothetical protein
LDDAKVHRSREEIGERNFIVVIIPQKRKWEGL